VVPYLAVSANRMLIEPTPPVDPPGMMRSFVYGLPSYLGGSLSVVDGLMLVKF
jgi:hypothetical protein